MSERDEIKNQITAIKRQLQEIERQVFVAPVEGLDYRELLLSFIGSLTLCDHLGDVAGDIDEVFKQAQIDIKWGVLDDLGPALGRLGVKTLYGSQLGEDA